MKLRILMALAASSLCGTAFAHGHKAASDDSLACYPDRPDDAAPGTGLSGAQDDHASGQSADDAARARADGDAFPTGYGSSDVAPDRDVRTDDSAQQ